MKQIFSTGAIEDVRPAVGGAKQRERSGAGRLVLGGLRRSFAIAALILSRGARQVSATIDDAG